jgi:hypothetical protein
MRVLIVFILAIVASAQAWAVDFDCHAPPFGAALFEIEGREMLVEYARRGDVAYYHYEGPCDYPSGGEISYAFVDDVLFARIVDAEDVDFEAARVMSPTIYGKRPRESREGDWIILTWNFRDKGIKHKLKYNVATRQLKSALYYEPLRERIRALAAQREIFDALTAP